MDIFAMAFSRIRCESLKVTEIRILRLVVVDVLMYFLVDKCNQLGFMSKCFLIEFEKSDNRKSYQSLRYEQ